MWGGKYLIIVSTHLDQEHLHNHFCFNSVSFLDGKKYNYSKSEQQRLRDTSDKLCREYGLSVIDRPKKAPSRPLYLDEKSGKPTRYNTYREDIWEALEHSFTLRHFAEYLIRKGYQVDLSGKHWKIKLPKYKYFTRMDTLEEEFTPDGICDYITDHYNYNRPAVIEFSPFCPVHLQDVWKPRVKTTRIYALYLYYCYQLGFLPKGTKYKPTSPYLKEELRKLDEISAHVNYMAKYKIETIDDLYADRKEKQAEMDVLMDERKHLRNKIRRASPEEKEQLRMEKAAVTAKIIQLRKDLKCNHSIEKRAYDIEERLNAVYENEQRANEKEKPKWKYSRDVR